MIFTLNNIIIACIILIFLIYIYNIYFITTDRIEKYPDSSYNTNDNIIELQYNDSNIKNITNMQTQTRTQPEQIYTNINTIDNVQIQPETTDIIITKPNNNNKKIVVLYYADWCTHCHDILPFFNDLINDNNDDNFEYKKIESKELEKYPEEMEKINGFPTIIIYYNMQEFNYNGSRDKNSLLQYVYGL